MNKYTIMIIIGVLAAALAYPIALHDTKQTQEITIDAKWVKYNNDAAKYLVSDTDGNVYSIEDSILFRKWDASNRYASIDEGETYTVTTVGWRIQLLSMYENIIEIEVKQ